MLAFSTRFLVLSLSIVHLRSVSAASSDLSMITNIFAFGDSWSSIGYNPAKDLDNVNLHNTTSGGEVWLQYLAQNYTSATSSMFDFASVGATIDNNLVFSNPATDFGSQVGLFETYFANSSQSERMSWAANDTLFAIWFGNDDLYNCFTTNSSFNDLVPRLLTSYDTAVNRLYRAGARYFLHLSLPDLSASPLGLSSENASSSLSSSVSEWNGRLKSYVSTLSAKYPGSNVTFYDTQSLTAKILDNPKQYGFNSFTTTCEAYSTILNSPDASDSSCQGPLQQYFWKTSWNPTWPVHQILASSVASALETSMSSSPTGVKSGASSTVVTQSLSSIIVFAALLSLAL